MLVASAKILWCLGHHLHVLHRCAFEALCHIFLPRYQRAAPKLAWHLILGFQIILQIGIICEIILSFICCFNLGHWSNLRALTLINVESCMSLTRSACHIIVDLLVAGLIALDHRLGLGLLLLQLALFQQLCSSQNLLLLLDHHLLVLILLLLALNVLNDFINLYQFHCSCLLRYCNCIFSQLGDLTHLWQLFMLSSWHLMLERHGSVAMIVEWVVEAGMGLNHQGFYCLQSILLFVTILGHDGGLLAHLV